VVCKKQYNQTIENFGCLWVSQIIGLAAEKHHFGKLETILQCLLLKCHVWAGDILNPE